MIIKKRYFLLKKQMVTKKKKKCDTNKNVTKMSVIIKGVYYNKIVRISHQGSIFSIPFSGMYVCG
jgi:hypothetical protein